VSSMTALQRLRAVAALWPYMVPLFSVYFAEYAMQSGTWTAIGEWVGWGELAAGADTHSSA
jgi:hypothetical protein